MSPLPIVAVVGATASGKSDLALGLAERLGGEIVNTDAFQVYRGMDIGTAKLPVAERRRIPHHLLDLIDVTEPATVSWFQELAKEVVTDCRARGVVPVLVGGSALYTRAIVDVFEFPATDPDVRAGYEARLEAEGPGPLHALLAELDPGAAAVMNPLNGRRLVRALEAIAVTGKPWSGTLPPPRYEDPATIQIGVDIDRPTLDARIAARVETMWAEGLVDEVRGLVTRGLRDGVTASRAIGYGQALAYLDGELTEEQARAQIAAGTRRFARRQDGWFRKDDRIVWVEHNDPERIEKAASAVAALRW